MEEKKHNFEEFRVGDAIYKTVINKMHKDRVPYVAPDARKLTAFIPGTILDIAFKKGAKVKEGDIILYLEAMKMKNMIRAPFDGKIKEIYVKEGDIVAKNFLVVEMQ